MTTQIPIVKNDANGAVFYIGLFSQASQGLQANPTLAAGDFKIAIDDGAPANLGTLPAVDADFTKRVKVVLSQAETNGDNLTIICSDAAGAEWVDQFINIQTAARHFDDHAYPTTSGRSIDVDASGGVEVGSFQAGAITAAAIATDAIDADALADGAITAATFANDAITAAKVAADVSAEIADAVWDEDATAHQTQGTFGQAIGDPAADTGTIFKATVTDATGVTVGTDTATLLTRLGTPSDLGGGATVAGNLSDIEAQTDDIGAAGAGLSAIPWNAAWDAEVQSEAADALTAYDPPTHAELTSELGTADDAVLAAIAALNNLSSSDAATAVLTTQMTESYNADGAAPTLAQALHLLIAALTEFSISGTTITAKKLDGSTTAATWTLDDAANPTSRTRAS